MKFKHKEQILNAPREKPQGAYKGIPLRLVAHLSIETARQRGMAWYAQAMKGETTTNIMLSSKDLLPI